MDEPCLTRQQLKEIESCLPELQVDAPMPPVKPPKGQSVSVNAGPAILSPGIVETQRAKHKSDAFFRTITLQNHGLQGGADTGELHRRAGADAERAAIVRYIRQKHKGSCLGFDMIMAAEVLADLRLEAETGKHLEATDDEELSGVARLTKATIDDAVKDILYYDRKDDEELKNGMIESSIRRGEFSASDMVRWFEEALKEGIDR